MQVRSSFFADVKSTGALGFGTTGLAAIASARERQRLFDTLLGGGVTHFDSAPYYGYGASERFLGELVTGRREVVTIATKFGIQPPRLLKSGLVNRAARAVLRLVPRLRGALARGARAATTQGAFSPADARRSLDASLRALRTNYVDLFLLHEPSSSDALRDDLIATLEDLRTSGKIRAFGCGGEFDRIAPVGAMSDRHSFLQFEDSVRHPHLDSYVFSQKPITYRSINGLVQSLAMSLKSDRILEQRWRKEIGAPCSSPDDLTTLLVANAVRRNREGVVLFSTSRLSHVEAALRGASVEFAEQSVVPRFCELAKFELNRTHSPAPAVGIQ